MNPGVCALRFLDQAVGGDSTSGTSLIGFPSVPCLIGGRRWIAARDRSPGEQRRGGSWLAG
jgi:hypothetical protein